MNGGLGFPFRITDRGRPTPGGSDADLARAQLHQLLFTAPGERVDRPGFGCGLHLLVFEPASADQAAATEYLIASAIRQHLARLVVLDAVRVTVDDTTLIVDILYTLRSDGQELAASFTQPLRLEPMETGR
ncbi:MAG: GPW/gp25 family protein [Acidimicrobiales bacterium]